MSNYPKRLIEVDLPIKRISEHARREKSIRHGHISTLHIWWARRPLAACRAVLCAALWPDPADPLCPHEFREVARAQMLAFADKTLIAQNKLTESMSKDTFSQLNTLVKRDPELDLANPKHLDILRHALLDFIADFANWDNSTNEHYLATARALTQAAHESLGGAPGTRPLVVDPFAGGGAIPLEALRVGADAFASDLNPVAVLLNKVVLEYIPRYGQQLADEIRKWGAWIKEQAEKELGDFYPKDEDGATPIAYLWARTITCEGPGCGCEVPLMRSFWLAKKKGGNIALKMMPNLPQKRVDFEIVENPKAKDIGEGTVKRGDATCPCCGYTTPVERVRAQLKARRGGAADARMLAVVTTHNNETGRSYRLPTQQDLDAVRVAADELERRKAAHTGELSLVPNEMLDVRGIRHTWAMLYGLDNWENMFTPRQALALTTLVGYVSTLDKHLDLNNTDFQVAVQTCLALAIDRGADYWSSLAFWAGNFVAHTFGRQAIPFISDFAEVAPFNEGSGNWSGAIDWISRYIERDSSENIQIGQALQASATKHPLADDSCHVFVTDPPYYDAVAYSYLSDYFYVWLKRSVGHLHKDSLTFETVPKDDEIIVDRPHELSNSVKDIHLYEERLTESFRNGRRILEPSGIGVVVFASKTTSSWEAILNAIISADFVITGSWPIDTERQGRVSAVDQARLQSSIHIVCRPRQNPDGTLKQDVGDWRDVLAELPHRIREWLPRLEQEGVVGADAIFSCLGPAMEIYSRYARVEKANGDTVPLSMFLEEVWAAVSREALALIFDDADTSGFEEDARLTVIWFWALKASLNGNGNGAKETDDEATQDSDGESSDEDEPIVKKSVSGYSMEYDTARKIAQGLGANLHTLSRPGGIVAVKGNLATLNSVSTREKSLIGFQLSLFGEDDLPQEVKTKRKRDVSVQMKDIANRQQRLFDEPIETQPDDSGQLQLPTFKRQFEDRRTLMQRLLDSGETILDRLHQAMLLHGRGQTALLGVFLQETGMGADTRFWRLADSLLRLYPKNTEEYRWLDGLLARKKGMGF